MGKQRSFSSHVRWSEAEVSIVRAQYSTANYEDLLAVLPGRSVSQIQNKAHAIGVIRHKEPTRTAEQTREAKRLHMARKRAKDPVAAREYHRVTYHANRDTRLVTMKAYQRKRFFWLKACKLPGVTAKDLASMWKKQRGLCGLTGERLDRTAEVDHILPKARGGGNEISNLRWVTARANRAKRDLTDVEFAALCVSVTAWIGERIASVEKIREVA